MSNINEEKTAQPTAPTNSPLTMRDLATVLVKHYGLHDGVYDLIIEYQIGMGGVGPDPSSPVPGVMIGASKVGLIPSTTKGPTAVDAAIVNPTKKMRKKN